MKKIFTFVFLLSAVVTFAHNGIISVEKSSKLNTTVKNDNVILPECWESMTQVAIYNWQNAEEEPTGWIFGTNAVGDKAVGQVFTNESTTMIEGAYFWIGSLAEDVGSENVVFSINEFADDAIGDIISSVTLPANELEAYMEEGQTPSDYTNAMYVEFDSPVEVTADFALVVDFSAVPYAAHGDGLGMVSNLLTDFACMAGQAYIMDTDDVWNVSTAVNEGLTSVIGMFPVEAGTADNYMVTFRVNMVDAITDHGFDPAEHNVFVTGDFADWTEPGQEGSVELTQESPAKEDVVILEEGFEGDVFPPDGWDMLDEDGDGNLWFSYAVDESAHTGEASAGSASWDTANEVPLTPDNWLITPQLDISNDTYMLEFYVGAQDPDWAAENYAVMISTTDTDPASFTNVWEETLTDAEWHMREVDLTDYAGEQIYIAFRHFEISDMFYIKIDDVKVYGTDGNGGEDIFYTATVEVPAGEIAYKYFSDAIGEGWAGGEYEGEGNDRTATIDADMTLEDLFGQEPVSVQNNLAETGINMYPNPVRNTLFVENAAQIDEVRIYDLTGRLVMSQVVDNNITTVNVSEFNRGVYIMQVFSENGVTSQKFNVIK